MKQGDSNVSAERKSAPAAAASNPKVQLYKCKNCSRQFKTSRARCGHQITHRMASEIRMKPYGAVLGAVLIHHIPSDDEDDQVSVPPPDEPETEPEHQSKKGTGSSKIKINAKGKEIAIAITKPKARAQPRALIKKAPVLEKPKSQQQPESEPQQELTKDLLGEWGPMCIARGEAEGSGLSWELTVLDLAAARVSDEKRDDDDDDDLDLELKLCSMNNKNVDLELKLGF